jgi:hypothetical protein
MTGLTPFKCQTPQRRPTVSDERGAAAGGTGTVLRAPKAARRAAAAGFTGFEVLPIDNLFWRFCACMAQ